MTAERRQARAALAVGAFLALAGLLAAGRPFVPLYDGVVPPDAYRWLDPPAGHPGDPKGATAKIAVSGGSNPLVAVATPENVPQAQIFAIPGGLILPKGTTEVDVSIEAVQPPSVPDLPGQVLTGNVYAITVTNQSGTVITASAQAQVSVVLRAPDALQSTATLARFDGTTWQSLGSGPPGVGATFEGVVTAFGDFALFAPPPAPTAAIPSAAASPSGSAPGSGGPSGPASAAVGPASDVPGTPSDGGFGGDRLLLAAVLGGLAVLIVALVGITALAPRRRGPPPREPRPRRR